MLHNATFRSAVPGPLIPSIIRSGACRLTALVMAGFALTACGSTIHTDTAEINNETKFSSQDYGVSASKRVTTSTKVKKGGGTYKIGKPYKVRGKWYYPKEEPGYDRKGSASWYGPNFHGRKTANGEIFDQNHLSGAHPTFPLPSYARVTNLDNGNSVIIRINDRGPFAKGRIVDVSSKAADLLDMKQAGTAKVRVQYVGQARMDGHDMKYLTASYQRNGRPHRLEAPSEGTGTSGVMLALAKPSKAITSVFSKRGADTAPLVSEPSVARSGAAEKGDRITAENHLPLPPVGPVPRERPLGLAATQPVELAAYRPRRQTGNANAPFDALVRERGQLTEAMIVQSWHRRLR